MLPELFIETGTMRCSSYASIWEASSTQYLVQLLHFNIYLFVISQQQLPNHCSFICCFYCTPNCYCDCSGVSANFAAPAIWDAATAILAASLLDRQLAVNRFVRSRVSCIKISRSLTVSTIDLWRAVCKEQGLLSQDPLVLLLVPLQVREELFHNKWRLRTQELFPNERRLRSWESWIS